MRASLSGLVTGWCALALVYAPAGPSLWSFLLALAFLLLVAVLRHRAPLLLLAWGGVIGWFLLVPAPSEADWLPESRVAPQLEVVGEQVRVRGIRDFQWRSQSDFEAQWVDRTYDLARLRSLDFFLSFWGPKRICHTFVSFGFERPNGGIEHVVVSIEVRKHEGQTYSALGSAFRQFPLIYIWALETDVIRVRTNFRGEEVYRYGVRTSSDGLRRIFLSYVAESQRLYEHPRWYNAVTSSCGVDILRTVWGHRVGFFPTFQQLFNGLWEKEAYDEGRLGKGLSFEQVRAEAGISPLAQKASLEDFSSAIRQHTVWLEIRKVAGP